MWSIMAISCRASFFLYLDIFMMAQFYLPSQGLWPQGTEAAAAAFSFGLPSG